MPLIKLETSAELNEDQKTGLPPILSKMIAEEIGKPETYVMVTLSQCGMMLSASDQPAAFAEIRSIGGLTADVNRAISRRICTLLTERLNILPDRVYLNFIELPGSNWGWNGRTFG